MPCFERSNYLMPVGLGYHASCEFNRKVYTTGGYDGANYYGRTWESQDGENFTRLGAANEINPARAAHAMVEHDGRLYLAGGNDGVNDLSDVWRSCNGKDWERIQANAFTARRSFVMLSYDKRLWVIGGWGPQGTCMSDCWASYDGVNWRQIINNHNILRKAMFAGCVFDGKMWISAGYDGNTTQCSRDCYWSVNGTDWNYVETPSASSFAAIHSHTMTVFDNKIVIIGGSTDPDILGVGMVDDLYFSRNGTDWALGCGNIGTTVMCHSAVAFTPKNRLFIYGGIDATGGFADDTWQSLGCEFLDKAW